MLGIELDPKGSIAEAYIATKALTFCSKYIETVDQLSKEVGEDNPGLNVFDYSARVTGKSRQEVKPKDLDKIVWYVLNNCPRYYLISSKCSTAAYTS